MGYGQLSAAQSTALSIYVRGRVVHDLGAGDLELSRKLIKLGARRVHAVDKLEKFYYASKLDAGLSYKSCYFHELPDTPMDVLFMSWPVNYEANLLPHVLRAGMVIYLGKNTDGSACGTPGLFEVMLRRKLHAYVPARKNSLVITGAYLDCPREPAGEERAGLHSQSEFFSFENAEAY